MKKEYSVIVYASTDRAAAAALREAAKRISRGNIPGKTEDKNNKIRAWWNTCDVRKEES